MTQEEADRLLVENGRLRAAVGALQQANAALREQVAGLTGQLQTALVRIAELEQRKPAPPAFVKPSRPRASEPQGPRKKRAAEHNTSRKRATPTRIERHVLEHCPDCHYRLSGESLDYRREVIELPPPQPVEVIEHQVIKRWCPCCGRWRSPQLALAGQVIGQGRIGVRVASLVSYLRTSLRLPFRAIQAYLATLHRLRLSVGELVALTHAVRQQLQPLADQLKVAVQASPVIHGDETGWRENGQNGYAWAFVTAGPPAVRYFEYDHSRSHRVAQRILGADWRGWLVTDFYAAYNLIPGRHQRCWVHLLRDLHDLKEEYATNPEVLAWAKALRPLYDQACTWVVEHPTPTLAERRAQYADLFTRACRLGEQYALTYDHPCCTLAKRVLRHQDELFQFVLVPGLPADNNLAERSIRPLVIMRKISGGSRSEEGTKTRLTLASLLHTWAARSLNPFVECLTALQQPAASVPP
jgi:transposase